MVFITFQNALTEEEEMLKQKYAKLRKKKKQLQALKAAKPEAQQKPSEQTAKRPAESAGEATEQAKKLVQSGAIKLASGAKEKTGFKRSKHMEKKLKEGEKPSSSFEFRPYSSSHSGEEDDKLESTKPKIRTLSESFVSSGSGLSRHDSEGRRERDRDDRRDRDRGRDDRRDREPPTKGHTVYVHGVGVTEEILRSAFSNFGNIVNINIERERNNGFVTFDKTDSADQAIANLNGSMVSHVHLKATLARRQPTFENLQDSSPNGWSSIAANQSQKGPSRKEDRNVVIYDGDDIF